MKTLSVAMTFVLLLTASLLATELKRAGALPANRVENVKTSSASAGLHPLTDSKQTDK